MSERRKITVRVDGSYQLGMGHVMRCIRIVEHLKGRITPLPEITFATAEDDRASQLLASHGASTRLSKVIRTPPIPPDEYDRTIFTPAMTAFPQDLLILDCNWEKHPEFMDLLPDVLPVVSLHEHNFPILEGVAAAVNPSLVKQNPAPNGKIGKTHFQGPDYLLLDEEIPDLAIKRVKKLKHPPNITICLGGSDPDGYTLQVTQALAGKKDLQLMVILGPSFPDKHRRQLPENPDVIIYEQPSRVTPLLAVADIAIVNAATTMLESIALGVPTITIPRNPYEKTQAEICAKAGAALIIDGDRITEDIPTLVEKSISEPELRKNLSMNGRKMIDGKGLSRVGDIIFDKLAI